MSVINKMLKDLEGRKAAKSPQNTALHGVDAAISLQEESAWRGVKSLGVVILCLLLLAAGAYIVYLRHAQWVAPKVTPKLATNNVNHAMVAVKPHNDISPAKAPPSQTEQTAVTSTKVTSVTAPTQRLIVKKPAMLSTTEKNDRLYQQALSAFESGQPQMAVNVLTQILQATPTDKDARQLLANYYFHSGLLDKAENVLRVGLAQDANYAGFTELEAHILLSKQKKQQALAMLKRATVDFNENPEYIAFQAGLEEQVGSPALAVQLYRQVLSVRPNNAVWWMGLGLALESQKNKNQAMVAYQRALEIGTLSDSLQEFVRQRVAAVKEG